MSEKITTTLFRFATMRAPELISEENQALYFLEHPDGETGDFFGALPPLPGFTKQEAIQNAALAFTGSELILEDVKAINPNMYSFATWLMTNRKNLTLSEANTKAALVTSLSSGEQFTLWDNLFYRTVTQNEPYIREAIIQMLIADHFKTNLTGVSDNAECRLLAQIRVVMPAKIFKIDTSYHTASTTASPIPNTTLLNKHLKAAESRMKSELAAKAVKEMVKVQADYNKNKRQEFYDAISNHLTVVDSTIETALTTAVDITDQFTGFTIKVFTDYTEPTLDYSPAVQIDDGELVEVLSSDAYHILNINGFNNLGTFKDVSKGLNRFIKDEVDISFANTDFKSESILVDGTPIPTCSLENRYNQKYAYLGRVVTKAPNQYALLMTLNTATPCVKMDKCTLSVIRGDLDVDYTKFKATNNNGIFTVEFNAGSYIPFDSGTGTINLSGQMQFNDGLVLNWSDTLDLTDGCSGFMDTDTNFAGNTNLFVPSGYGLTRIGVADYRKVEQHLCCYEPGEVCHIENVMAREYKERSTRRLRKSEETSTSRSESEREKLTDTSTTSRFEMSTEIAEVLSKSTEFGISANVHASARGKMGVYDVEASADVGANYASNTSKENSNNQATSFAKDVTAKALDRLVQKVFEERVSKVIEEFEEQNKHGMDNRLSPNHISGVYRWINKVYKNEIHNYGKRVQYEFMIPEPAAFHLIARSTSVPSGNELALSKPSDPRKDTFGMNPLKSAGEINESNYQQWAAIYNTQVSPPPAEKLVVGKSYGKSQQAGDGNWDKNKFITDNVVIPEGYGVDEVYTSINCSAGTVDARVAIGVADKIVRYKTMVIPTFLHVRNELTMDLDKYSDTVPVSVFFEHIWGGIVQVSIELIRKAEHYIQWQLDTFSSIISAYEDRLQEYKDQLAEQEIKRGTLMAENPAYYADIIKTVMKKNCISYLIGHANMGKSFIHGNEMRDFYVTQNAEMDKYAATVKFMEQAFEWDIMSYRFYPFYWAGSDKWHERYGYQNDDPAFREFIQSGMARTIVTVRPEFEAAVNYYMATGQIWNGGEVPVIGEPLFLSIIQELKEQESKIEDTWKSYVPSDLVVIQSGSIGLDASGLPCWCDEEEPPTETFVDSEALQSNGAYIDGYSLPEPPPEP